MQTGKLVQVIEGENIRLLHWGEEAVLVAMKKANGQRSGGTEDALIELIPTQAIEATPSVQSPELWDEWDM